MHVILDSSKEVDVQHFNNVTVEGVPKGTDCGPVIYKLIDEDMHSNYLKLKVQDKLFLELKAKSEHVGEYPIIIKASLPSDSKNLDIEPAFTFLHFKVKIENKNKPPIEINKNDLYKNMDTKIETKKKSNRAKILKKIINSIRSLIQECQAYCKEELFPNSDTC